MTLRSALRLIRLLWVAMAAQWAVWWVWAAPGLGLTDSQVAWRIACTLACLGCLFLASPLVARFERLTALAMAAPAGVFALRVLGLMALPASTTLRASGMAANAVQALWTAGLARGTLVMVVVRSRDGNVNRS